jgi:thymidylate synthase (FAD)
MTIDLIKCLDHGFVRLVGSMGNDLSIVRSARVSYDADWRAGSDKESDTKLIRYLWKNKHTTPFESVELQFEVKAPIFVLRQWHRHRTWSYNELSARYRVLPAEYYIPDPEVVGEQSQINKQARRLFRNDWGQGVYKAACEKSYLAYLDLLEGGWPRELARAVLPAAMYSHMFAKVNLHNLFHFLTLRSHAHAQYEIRIYAEAMLELITPIVPVAVQAWKESNDT